MKTAEEYSDDVMKLWSKFDWDEINFNQFKNYVKNYIEQAQKEAYNQALQDATEKAKVSLFEMNTYDKKTYEQDFPEHGYFNWKIVKLKTPEMPYYDGHKIIGVVLHDGNFMTNGVLFLKNQYEIIDEDPLKLNCL